MVCSGARWQGDHIPRSTKQGKLGDNSQYQINQLRERWQQAAGVNISHELNKHLLAWACELFTFWKRTFYLTGTTIVYLAWAQLRQNWNLCNGHRVVCSKVFRAACCLWTSTGKTSPKTRRITRCPPKGSCWDELSHMIRRRILISSRTLLKLKSMVVKSLCMRHTSTRTPKG